MKGKICILPAKFRVHLWSGFMFVIRIWRRASQEGVLGNKPSICIWVQPRLFYMPAPWNVSTCFHWANSSQLRAEGSWDSAVLLQPQTLHNDNNLQNHGKGSKPLTLCPACRLWGCLQTSISSVVRNSTLSLLWYSECLRCAGDREAQSPAGKPSNTNAPCFSVTSSSDLHYRTAAGLCGSTNTLSISSNLT